MSNVSGSRETTNNAAPPSQLYNHGQPINEAGAPAEVSTPPQQGAPEPGSGTEVHAEKVAMPFKDQMVGHAKSIRGKVLNKPETKATGDKILNGEMTAKEYFEQKKERKDSASSS